jgi:hypothetical protein
LLNRESYILGKLINDENQTIEQHNLQDYDVVTCQQALCTLSFNHEFSLKTQNVMKLGSNIF